MILLLHKLISFAFSLRNFSNGAMSLFYDSVPVLGICPDTVFYFLGKIYLHIFVIFDSMEVGVVQNIVSLERSVSCSKFVCVVCGEYSIMDVFSLLDSATGFSHVVTIGGAVANYTRVLMVV